MLYVDSSALIKGYLHEKGTEEFKAKMREAAAANLPVITSVLTYAEIHTALARKMKSDLLRVIDYHWAATRFESDWRTYLTRAELSQPVLSLIPDLVKKYPLKAADAVQLASAIWAVGSIYKNQMRKRMAGQRVFVTSDSQLAGAAEKEQFKVFNPETA